MTLVENFGAQALQQTHPGSSPSSAANDLCGNNSLSLTLIICKMGITLQGGFEGLSDILTSLSNELLFNKCVVSTSKWWLKEEKFGA